MERIQKGGHVPPWYDNAEWDETEEGRGMAAVTEVADGSSTLSLNGGKQRLGYAAPAASLSSALLAVSNRRLAARRQRWQQHQGQTIGWRDD